MVQILAMYLPQFHRIPENDSWWGEGFTDWVSARNAKPLFDGHYQPHIPLNENYYDLLEKNTMVWQADLMHQYGVDGICMYHYWFEDGRRILEKPEQNLLKWKDIDMPFCLCWANESWARSWTNIEGSSSRNVNVWDMKSDKNSNKRELLLKQSYGCLKQWQDHYEYLLNFFTDERYLTVEGRPVFVIYNPTEIGCLSEMILAWKRMAIKHGQPQMYIIGIARRDMMSSFVDANLLNEPHNAKPWMLSRDNHEESPQQIEYSDLCDVSIASESTWEKCYYGGIVGYDDTPRRGKRGCCLTNSSTHLFENYLRQLIKKNTLKGNELLFLNAWNEWGEGMHLEPDEKNGYGYLEAVRNAKEYGDSLDLNERTWEQEPIYQVAKHDVFSDYFKVMDEWMTIRERGKSIADFLRVNNYNSVTIYGYGVLGRHLYKELIDSNIEIVAVVDKKDLNLNLICNTYKPSDDIPKAELVINTAAYYKDEILRENTWMRESDSLSIDYIISELLFDEEEEQ